MPASKWARAGALTPAGAGVAQAEHLAHWGINMDAQQKTEKTMAELQIDLNMSFEFDRITEAGAALQPLSGPGCARRSRPRACPASRRSLAVSVPEHSMRAALAPWSRRPSRWLARFRHCTRPAEPKAWQAGLAAGGCLFWPDRPWRVPPPRGRRAQARGPGQPGQQLLHEQRAAGAVVAAGRARALRPRRCRRHLHLRARGPQRRPARAGARAPPRACPRISSGPPRRLPERVR